MPQWQISPECDSLFEDLLELIYSEREKISFK
jgi:hypothetical protein